MRLLEPNDDGEFSLTKDFGDDPPRYAILSHTWGADTEEVTAVAAEINDSEPAGGDQFSERPPVDTCIACGFV